MSPAVLRWLSLVALLWLQSINGTNSNFAAYSSQLKAFLSISQLKLNYLSFASDFGKVFGFVSGVSAVHLPLWLVLLLGSFIGFAGYGLQYLCIVHNMFSLSFFHIWLLTFLAGNSICWINTVCYTVAINNFPLNRQVAVGITASYLGLSGKIYTDIVEAFFASSPSKAAEGYLILNPLLPLIVCIMTAPMLRDVEAGATSSRRTVRAGFIMMFVITTATGIYAVITSLAPTTAVMKLVGMALLLLAPLAIPLRIRFEEFVFSRRSQQKICDEESSNSSQTTVHIQEDKEEEEEEEGFDGVGVKEEIRWKEIWRRIDFWIYFIMYLCGPTVGLVFLNNLGQIAESRGSPASSYLVALSSSFGFFGRLLPSLLDYFFSRYMPSRPASMAVSMASMAGSFFVLLMRSNVALYVSTAGVGVFTGAITSLSVSMTAELFGTKYFGVNHNIVVGNIPIGSFVFGLLAAKIYRRGANREDGKCMGMHCFASTFVMWGSLCSLATLFAFLLYYRNRNFYSQRRY